MVNWEVLTGFIVIPSTIRDLTDDLKDTISSICEKSGYINRGTGQMNILGEMKVICQV